MQNTSGKWRAMSTDRVTAHTCSSNNNSSSSNNSNREVQVPERPKAFMTPNNNSEINRSENITKQAPQSQQEQQSQAQVVYPYSVKIEQDSKGKAKVSIHVYGVDADATKDEAVRLFVKTQDGLKDRDIAVLESTITKEEDGVGEV
jgi:hypothetical protein